MKGGGGRIIEVRVGIELLPIVERERRVIGSHTLET